ncbi:hypothetical protein DFH29DRAFT_1084423 [Suillus ampliporus]|nr:hypothetical protein DFH29DRAFT_1084423 [Suillus ampliporus]
MGSQKTAGNPRSRSQSLDVALANLVGTTGCSCYYRSKNAKQASQHFERTRDQVFFPLDTAEESAAALRAANDAHAVHLPDTVFSYAGAAKLVYLLDMQVEDLTRHGHEHRSEQAGFIDAWLFIFEFYESSMAWTHFPLSHDVCAWLGWGEQNEASYIEPTDEGLTAELAAAGLLAGMSSTMSY